jgi:hypothetical protein
LGPSSFLGSVFLQLGGLFRDEDANVRAAASTALAKLGGAGRRYRRPLRHANKHAVDFMQHAMQHTVQALSGAGSM